MKGIIILTVCILSATVAFSSEPVSEFLTLEEDFTSATAKSRQLSRSQVLIFSASWCAPCIKMKETTLKDASLVRYLNENTINSLVDIDTKEGFRLMSEFGVRELPCIIILDANGKETARKKEFMAAQMFEKFVASNISMNATGKKAPIATAAGTAVEPVSKSKPELNQQEASKPVKNVDANSINTQGYINNSFGVQVGIFSSFETAIAETSRIQKLVPEADIMIQNRSNGAQPQFRLVIGVFLDKETARKIKSDLQEKGVEGFVKDLSVR